LNVREILVTFKNKSSMTKVTSVSWITAWKDTKMYLLKKNTNKRLMRIYGISFNIITMLEQLYIGTSWLWYEFAMVQLQVDYKTWNLTCIWSDTIRSCQNIDRNASGGQIWSSKNTDWRYRAENVFGSLILITLRLGLYQ
jgi:hypothetical protein